MKKTIANFNSAGFTLIELMITVAIMGILLSIAVPKFSDLIRRSNEGATKGNLGSIRSAMNIYYGESEGWYPVSDPGPILTMDTGKYLRQIPNSYCPPYHAKTAMFDTSGTTETTNSGSWSYQANNTAVLPAKSWGDVWVNCTHTDMKSTTWSNY